jgi:hypothetical protein
VDDDVDLLGALGDAGDAAMTKITSESQKPEKPGSDQGARRSHSMRPLPKPRRRMPISTPAGTVKPWIIEASTARYMA